MNIFEGDDGNKRVYIPGTIDDNPILLEDERYIKFLEGLKRTDPNLYKAWRHGDWSVFEGQFFREFDTYMHATKASTPKENVNWVGGADWGYSPRPFVFISGALQSVNYKGVNFSRLWIDDEIVRRQKTPKKLARIIKKRVPNINSFSSLRIDPSAKTKGDDGSISIKDQFSEAGIDFLEANNDRVNGWQAVRDWFSIAPDGLPYMLINERCNKLITNLPMLVYDDTKKDDLDTEGPDDEADALRYMIMHLKWIDAADAEAIPRGGKDAPVGGFTNERDEWDDDE
jgi:phage terminase large subunit